MRKILFTAAGLLAAVAIGFSIQAWVVSIPTPETVETAPASPSASPTPGVTSTPDAEATPQPEDSSLTIVITAEMAYSPTLTPPDFVNVFQLVDPDDGYYRTGGTTYLVAHSYAKGYGAPGNDWETLEVGEVFSQGGSLWEVDRVATPGHNDIGSQPVWTNDPDAIVLITCLSRGPGQPATNNYLISGHRVG